MTLFSLDGKRVDHLPHQAEFNFRRARLISAVLPRYHIDERIKRSLGSKIGTLKDKDGG